MSDVTERLRRDRAAAGREQRAVTTTVLGGLIPAVIPPYAAEAVAYGVRSTAPLATALLRLDLPPVGTTVDWAKVTTPGRQGGRARAPLAIRAAPHVRDVLAAVVSLFELARFMGTSVEQIDKTYGHLLPDSIERARVALDEFVSGACPAEADDGR